MGSGFEAIVLNVGIAAAAPFSVNSIPKIAIASPPTLVNSIAAETVAGDWTIGTDPAPAATDTLRFLGGLVSDTAVGTDSFIAGRGAVGVTIANGRNVQIGTLSRCDNSGGGGATVNTSLNVVIGYNAGLTQGVGSCVIISPDFVFGGSFPGGNLVAVGYGITVNNAATGPLVGTSISAQGQGVAFGKSITTGAFNNGVVVGQAGQANANNVTVVGDGAHGNHTTAIVVGRNAVSFQANQFVAGATNLGITSVLFGEGDTVAAYGGITYRCTNGSGNNDTAATVTWTAPLGTGNAVGGGFQINVGVAGASGAGLQASTVAIRVEGGTRNVAFWGAGSFGSGVGVFFLANAGTNPSTNPAGGGILYVNAGALTYRGSGGTVTVIAPA